MGKDEEWFSVAQSNTQQLTHAIRDLEDHLNKRDFRVFWQSVKGVSTLFKELRPTLKEERQALWQQFDQLCGRAKEDQERERKDRSAVSSQKRQLVLSKIDEAYHQARGADSGHDLKLADELLQQALGWMKDGYSGFNLSTQYFAVNDGKMLKEDHDTCWDRWTEVKDIVRARRTEICNFNYGHFKNEAYQAKGWAEELPKDAKEKVKQVEGEMKGRTMQKWQFDEINDILDGAWKIATSVLLRRHQEWERKQAERQAKHREWQQRMRETKSRKLAQIDNLRDIVANLERQIDHCRDLQRSAKSWEFESQVQGWIDEKYAKIRDIERTIADLGDSVRDIDSKLD